MFLDGPDIPHLCWGYLPHRSCGERWAPPFYGDCMAALPPAASFELNLAADVLLPRAYYRTARGCSMYCCTPTRRFWTSPWQVNRGQPLTASCLAAGRVKDTHWFGCGVGTPVRSLVAWFGIESASCSTLLCTNSFNGCRFLWANIFPTSANFLLLLHEGFLFVPGCQMLVPVPKDPHSHLCCQCTFCPILLACTTISGTRT